MVSMPWVTVGRPMSTTDATPLAELTLRVAVPPGVQTWLETPVMAGRLGWER